jgi:uncharacterized membrane protein
MIGSFVLFALVAALAAGLVNRTQNTPGEGQTALRILDERLGRGEIDADEYRAKRALIEGTAP